MPIGISYRAMLAAAGSSAAADAYIVNSFAPPVVADFAGVLNGGTPYFRVGGSDSSFASMFTFARSSTAYYRASDGTLTQASSGAARKDHYKWNGSSWVRAGILLESEARTNLITQSDDMSGWTTSNMTVAKNQTGADGVTNSAHSLTATSGSATVLTTITAASNPHVYSALVKRITGTGTIEMTVNGGTNWINVTSLINSSEFIQVGTGAGTTVTNPQVGFRITTSGDAIAVQINQLEQTSGQFSSPIPTSGATVTRAAETLTIGNVGAGTTDISAQVKGEVTYADNIDTPYLMYIGDVTNRFHFYLKSGGAFNGEPELNIYDGSSGHFNDGPNNTYQAGVNVAYNIAGRLDRGTQVNIALDGVEDTAEAYTGTPDYTGLGWDFSHDYMGTYELARVWPTADIGDTGIESATS